MIKKLTLIVGAAIVAAFASSPAVAQHGGGHGGHNRAQGRHGGGISIQVGAGPYAAPYGYGYAPNYGYAPRYGYAPSYGYAPRYGYGAYGGGGRHYAYDRDDRRHHRRDRRRHGRSHH